MTFVLTILGVVFVIFRARLNGLRSFSKMSSFDFALTLATGSILASLITSADDPWPEMLALAALFLSRFIISKARLKSAWVANLVDNRPLVLMYAGEFLERNLRLGRVTRSDVISKLREANALDLKQVRAVVLETTGDVSVLHGGDLDGWMLEGVSWGHEQAPEALQT